MMPATATKCAYDPGCDLIWYFDKATGKWETTPFYSALWFWRW